MTPADLATYEMLLDRYLAVILAPAWDVDKRIALAAQMDRLVRTAKDQEQVRELQWQRYRKMIGSP